MNDVDAHIDAEEQPPQPLCTNCFHPTAENDDFCSNCEAPVGLTVTIDPLKRIFAMGFIYKKVANNPINGYMLIATWLIFLPMFLPVVLLIEGINSLMQGELDSPEQYIFPLFISTLSAIILYKVTRNYLKTRSKNLEENTEDS